MKYEDIKVGQTETLVHEMRFKDVLNFCAMTGDWNKLHCSEEYAVTTEFKHPIVHGMLTASFISTLVGMKLPGTGAVWYKHSITFLLPVYTGDTLTIKGQVSKKFDDKKHIELIVDVFNQKGEVVVYSTCLIKCLE